MTDLPRTVKGVLEAAAGYLASKQIENPRLAGELLLSRLLRCKRLELYLRFDAALSDKQLEAMRRGIRRVAAGEPVQYVLGETDFMGHILKVDKRALIPRPETEGLVETVLSCQDLWTGGAPGTRPIIVDVGTGSGCIVISLALARPEGVYIGLDTSAEALDLARENAAALGVAERVCLTAAELTDAVEPESLRAIVSNPPYVPTSAYEALPAHIRDHEPRVALDGGHNGLAVTEALIADAAMALAGGGFLFLEIGADQGRAVSDLLRASGFEQIAIRKDLAGRDRVAVARLPASDAA